MNTEKLPFDIEMAVARTFRAGPIELDYENGDIRQLKVGPTEIIRRVYMAVRNHVWDTADCHILEENIKETDKSFEIGYSARYSYNGVEVYEAAVTISGMADGTVDYQVRGKALAQFSRNRIGICVHHPIRECVGREVTITDPAGHTSVMQFPQLISPHQPFLNIRQMHWKAGGVVEASVDFEGDIFESEDQRNWGDACYKTYSTPLSIPIPVQVNAGDVIEQRLTIKVQPAPRATGVTSAAKPELTENSFPKIGYARPASSNKLTPATVDLLKKVPFDGYRCELRLADAGWQQLLQECVSEAQQLATKLDLVVFFNAGNDSETQELLQALIPSKDLLNSLLVLQDGQKVTPKSLINATYPVLKADLPQMKIGYGADGYFTELNRNRPDGDTLFDFVSFSTNPQVHASDARSIMENVEALPWIITTARSFAQGKEVYVSPLTLKRRRNHDVKGAAGKEPTDKRMGTSFAARFTLLAVAALSGADRIILHETLGARGLIDDRPLPTYDALEKVASLVPVSISSPIEIDWNSEVVVSNEKGEKLRFAAPGT